VHVIIYAFSFWFDATLSKSFSMDPVGVAASVITLADLAKKVASALFETVKSINDAPHQLQDAIIKVSFVQSQLEQLAEIGFGLSRDDDHLLAARFRQSIESSLRRTQKANFEIGRALLRVNRTTPRVRIVRWVFIDHHTVEKLTKDLRHAQEGLSFAVQILELFVHSPEGTFSIVRLTYPLQPNISSHQNSTK
jgi:hypothetical protein